MVMLFDQEYAVQQYGKAQKEEGRAEGEGNLAKLMSILLEKGLVQDAQKAATDKGFRDRLYAEYQLELEEMRS